MFQARTETVQVDYARDLHLIAEFEGRRSGRTCDSHSASRILHNQRRCKDNAASDCRRRRLGEAGKAQAADGLCMGAGMKGKQIGARLGSRELLVFAVRASRLRSRG